MAAVLGLLLAVVRTPAPAFVYDAYSYWQGAVTIVRFDNFFEAGGLMLRGTLTSAVYVPAAIVTNLTTAISPSQAVLIQNGILIAVIGAIVMPGLASLFIRVSTPMVIGSAIATALLLGGFAPYPLMDLWSVALVLTAILLVAKYHSWWSLATAGLAVGAAVNLRPAYLVAVVIVFVAWVLIHRLGSLWILLGVFASLIPQLIVNLHFARRLLPWPVDSQRLVEVQSIYSAFVVRFDGVAYYGAAQPQQFFCDPTMAARFIGGAPMNSWELLQGFATTLPRSIWFFAQKIAASLFWTPDTPYAAPFGTALNPISVVVVAVSAIGAVALVWIIARGGRVSLRVGAPLLALWLGAVATLAYSTPETRFALPAVLIGLVGCLVGAGVLLARIRVARAALVWLGVALALTVGLLWVGSAGLAHPAPPGGVTAQSCAVA